MHLPATWRSTWRRSLVLRLTVTATAAAALALAVVLGGLYVAFARTVQADLDAGLAARSTDLVAAARTGGVGALAAEPYAQLLSDDGDVLVTTEALSTGARLVPVGTDVPCSDSGRLLDTTVDVPDRRGTLAVRVLARCTEDGVLAVAASRAPQQEAQERLLLALLLVGPLLLALVALVVWRTARSALRPVAALASAARRISSGADVRSGGLPAVTGEDEIARLADTLDAMLARLAEAFEHERSFLDDASHELRTPAAVLQGELELALESLGDEEAVETSLRAAAAEAERLGRLTDDLLALARADAGTLRPELVPVDLRDLLLAVVVRLEPVLDLEVAVDCPPVVLDADPDALERVVINLLRNAVAAGAGTARLTVTQDAGVIDLLVEDDGDGFPPGFAAVAFDRFRRSDTARTRAGGAGLGLSIVRALVAAHSGTVSAQEQAGALGGAAVHVRLPARAPT